MESIIEFLLHYIKNRNKKIYYSEKKRPTEVIKEKQKTKVVNWWDTYLHEKQTKEQTEP